MDLESILVQIRPDDNQLNCLSGIVSTLGNILVNSSNTLKIKKVTPAGSVGRDTILKGHLEVDCVYILEHNGFSYFNYFFEVRRCLAENLPEVKDFKIGSHSISFQVEKPIGTISIDLLPAFEINSPKQMREVRNRDFYYGSTSLLQKKYFKRIVQKYPRFKDLVRLIKLWKNTWDIPLTSYMIELIIANAIFRTSGEPDFPFYLESCFRNIQSFTDGTPILPVSWDDQYDNSEIDYDNPHNELWLLDPSVFSENIATEISEDEKSYIRSESTFGGNCCRNSNYSFLYSKG